LLIFQAPVCAVAFCSVDSGVWDKRTVKARGIDAAVIRAANRCFAPIAKHELWHDDALLCRSKSAGVLRDGQLAIEQCASKRTVARRSGKLRVEADSREPRRCGALLKNLAVGAALLSGLTGLLVLLTRLLARLLVALLLAALAWPLILLPGLVVLLPALVLLLVRVVHLY
jgi:hypothetical protein